MVDFFLRSQNIYLLLHLFVGFFVLLVLMIFQMAKTTHLIFEILEAEKEKLFQYTALSFKIK